MKLLSQGIRWSAETYSSIRTSNTMYFSSELIMEDLFDLFDLFEVQPEGRMWRGAVNGQKAASSKLAELSAKSGKPVFAMNLQTREILEFVCPDK